MAADHPGEQTELIDSDVLVEHGTGDHPTSDLPPDRDAGVVALFDAHYVQLLALAARLLEDGSVAEDVVMDAFVGLYWHWGSVQRSDNVYFYLRACVVNNSRSRSRRFRLAAARLFTQVERPAAAADQSALAHLEQDAVVVGLRRLSRRQREVLVLRYYDEMSEAEIATTLGCSVGSVKTHASRGLHALAEQLGRV
jgi:RNA polymerase sigma-70 factor (sigma-E family)